MANRRTVADVVFAAFAAILPTGAAGNAYYRCVRGVVTDEAGQPVCGATVQLKDTRTLRVRSCLTAQGGTYSFYALNTAKDYELQAAWEGRRSRVRTLSRLRPLNPVTVNLKLPPNW